MPFVGLCITGLKSLKETCGMTSRPAFGPKETGARRDVLTHGWEVGELTSGLGSA